MNHLPYDLPEIGSSGLLFAKLADVSIMFKNAFDAFFIVSIALEFVDDVDYVFFIGKVYLLLSVKIYALDPCEKLLSLDICSFASQFCKSILYDLTELALVKS